MYELCGREPWDEAIRLVGHVGTASKHRDCVWNVNQVAIPKFYLYFLKIYVILTTEMTINYNFFLILNVQLLELTNATQREILPVLCIDS